MTQQRPSSPTIKHLATRLGLSHSTVSRALNGRPGIHRETRERVQAEAQRQGYVANGAAQILKQKSSSVVGLVVPNIRNRFYGSVAKTMADAASAQSGQLMLFTTDDDPNREAQAIHSLVGSRAAAVVIAATASPTPKTLELLQSLRVIQLIRRHPAVNAPVVEVDDTLGIALATAHLLARGHQRIAYIGPSIELSTGRHRLDGFLRAYDAAGRRADGDWIATGPPRTELAAAALGHILAARPIPTGLVVGSPELAEGVLQEVFRRGIAVPEALSLVCYGDRSWYEMIFGGLTAVRLPEEDIARACVDLLFAASGSRTEGLCLLPSLVERNSVATLIGSTECTEDLNPRPRRYE